MDKVILYTNKKPNLLLVNLLKKENLEVETIIDPTIGNNLSQRIIYEYKGHQYFSFESLLQAIKRGANNG